MSGINRTQVVSDIVGIVSRIAAEADRPYQPREVFDTVATYMSKRLLVDLDGHDETEIINILTMYDGGVHQLRLEQYLNARCTVQEKAWEKAGWTRRVLHDGSRRSTRQVEPRLFRPVTLDEAKRLPQGGYVLFVGLDTVRRAKVTSVKTWKRSPEKVLVTAKYGLKDFLRFDETKLNQIVVDVIEEQMKANAEKGKALDAKFDEAAKPSEVCQCMTGDCPIHGHPPLAAMHPNTDAHPDLGPEETTTEYDVDADGHFDPATGKSRIKE